MFCSDFTLQDQAASKIQKQYRLSSLQKKVQKDIDAVKCILEENHPGQKNPFDCEFRKFLECGYVQACIQVSKIKTSKDHLALLKKFAGMFHDSHLYVQEVRDRSYINVDIQDLHDFKITHLTDRIVKVTIPTFQIVGGQITQIRKIIEQVPLYRDYQAIIFDVRGNSGGNSQWAEDICASLFGDVYFEYKKQQLQRNETVWWRVSNGNFEYLKNIKPMIEQQFSDDAAIVQEFEQTLQGMKSAYEHKESFYVQPNDFALREKQRVNNPVKAKIIVLIDQHCVSACLDFIDYLKILSDDVLLIGQTTKADSIYMEIRSEILPSKKAVLYFPIKMYQGRMRGHNQPYYPDIFCSDLELDMHFLDALLR